VYAAHGELTSIGQPVELGNLVGLISTYDPRHSKAHIAHRVRRKRQRLRQQTSSQVPPLASILALFSLGGTCHKVLTILNS
jgi:hypothetical protein